MEHVTPRRSVVAGLLALVLLTSALASACPALHHALHQHDRSASHFCFITSLQDGHVDHTASAAVLIVAQSGHCGAAIHTDSSAYSFSFASPPGRGPPVCS